MADVGIQLGDVGKVIGTDAGLCLMVSGVLINNVDNFSVSGAALKGLTTSKGCFTVP